MKNVTNTIVAIVLLGGGLVFEASAHGNGSGHHKHHVVNHHKYARVKQYHHNHNHHHSHHRCGAVGYDIPLGPHVSLHGRFPIKRHHKCYNQRPRVTVHSHGRYY